jgi:hypothetical protein
LAFVPTIDFGFTAERSANDRSNFGTLTSLDVGDEDTVTQQIRQDDEISARIECPRQVAPHITSIVNLVAAELGVSLVPAAMMQLRVTGIVYRQITGQSPTTRLALAFDTSATS